MFDKNDTLIHKVVERHMPIIQVYGNINTRREIQRYDSSDEGSKLMIYIQSM